MKFNYRLGTEATFIDWEEDGCKRAEEILDALEQQSESAEKESGAAEKTGEKDPKKDLSSHVSTDRK